MSCPVSHAVPSPSSTPMPVPVKVDTLGGGVLRDQAGSTLTMVAPELCYLDVIDCPELVSLDLSRCHPNCHVTLRGCPSLRSLYVPETGSGAVIHLDSGDTVPSLHVFGCVDHFDACWTSGQCAVSADDVPWRHLWVSRHVSDLSRSHPAFDAECWVVLAPAAPHLVVDAPQLRHFYVSGSRELLALSVLGMAPERSQIEVQTLPELVSMEVKVGTASAWIRECRALTELSGAVTELHASQVGQRAEALHVDMTTDRFHLCHSRVSSLTLSQPTALFLVHCPTIERVSLPPTTTVHCEGAVPPPLVGVATVVVDEAVVMSLIAAYRHDPASTMAELATLIPSMSPASHCIKALRLLDQLAQCGAPLEEVWAIRLALSVQHLTPHSASRHGVVNGAKHKAHSEWLWELPSDLGREGWQADYRLWVRCAPVVSDAFHYRRSMIRSCTSTPDGLATQTVIHAMARDDGDTPRHERELWSDILHGMSSKAPLSVRCWPRYARSLSARYGNDPTLDRAYLNACQALLPLHELLDLLQRLDPAHPEVRLCLLRIAQRSHYWRAERCDDPGEADRYRATAMALAMSRPRQVSIG